MAQTGRLTRTPALAAAASPVMLLRIALIAAVLLGWQALSASGLLFRDVVPSLGAIAGALTRLLLDSGFYWHLGATGLEIATALVIGGLSGLAVGLALGANRLLGKAFEPYLYYLGPTPKIIFFPIMIMWFGVGPGSKVAMGVVSCFFPVALSAAAGMRRIDRVLIRVGRSFRAGTWHMVSKIYLPAMREPVVNGIRLGFGVAVIGTLLAETKLSNRGVGFLVINSYSTFDMPRMYALLIVVFVIAIGANALIGRLGAATSNRQS
jgi:ABC-type nitrate/sulfonate/bicarbonate transport system permease component